MQQVLEVELQRSALAGMGAVVVRSSGVAGLACAGRRHKGESSLVALEDFWHLGSNTKAVTATLLARLVESGALGWATTPAEVFPNWRQHIRPAYRRITIEEILSHHARLLPFTEVTTNVVGGWPEQWPRLSGAPVEQRAQFAELVLSRRPPASARRVARYSNAGPVLAAAIAERVTGQSWEDLLQDMLLKPLGISAVFGFPRSAGADEPWGHYAGGGGLFAVDGGIFQMPIYMIPSGGLSMRLAEYGKFLQLHLVGLRGVDGPLLTAKSVQKLHAPGARDRSAMGWEVETRDGVLSSTHNGSGGTFYALTVLQPSRDLGVAVVLNSGGDESINAASRVMKVLLAMFGSATPEGVPRPDYGAK